MVQLCIILFFLYLLVEPPPPAVRQCFKLVGWIKLERLKALCYVIRMLRVHNYDTLSSIYTKSYCQYFLLRKLNDYIIFLDVIMRNAVNDETF